MSTGMQELEHLRLSSATPTPSHAPTLTLGPYTDDFPHPQPQYARASPSFGPSRTDSPASGPLLPTAAPVDDEDSEEDEGGVHEEGKQRRRPLIALGALAALAIIVLAVVLPVYFVVIKKPKSSSSASASKPDSTSSGGGSTSGGVVAAITGADGSVVTAADGSTFVYNNSFGGYWLADPTNPFALGARANSWTPPLNQSWTWGTDRVYGVNLGGWFVLEPFIAPALFQAYPSATDEWSLAALMRADGTLQATMEKHYDTFITEQDIAQIAGAGLNWVRVPIPFWAISTWQDVGSDSPGGPPVAEPFLEGVCWKYIVRLLGWARKYGIRVNLDLHTVPGSQNGYNHSGRGGQINWLNGIMGVANAQRTIDYIRIIAEFIAQPEYKEVVGMFGVINEARLMVIGRPQLTAFYLQVHDMIRNITGRGEGKGPYISVHDGFDGLSEWAGFLPGSDRVILDTHPYFAFSGSPNTQPIATGEDPANAGGQWPQLACNSWGSSINNSRSNFGVTVAGEWSNGYNDCGLFLDGVGGTPHYGGDCSFWEDSSQWNASVKAGVAQFSLASMDAMGDWFFWTWKIGAAADGVVRSPLWSYQLGLQGGWMPTDPRTAFGKCAAIGVRGSPFDGTFSAWQTGGAGAGTIDATVTQQFGVWPPATISNVDAGALTVLPTYTATGSVATLTYITPSVTRSTVTPTVTPGNGWFNAGDTAPGVTAVAGCTYPDAWSALNLPAPTTLCKGS